MVSDDKKTKATPAPKKEVPAENKSAAAADSSKAEGGKAEGGKAESSEAAGSAPANYSRGEGQKPVSKAYKENWNAIFANDKKSKNKKKKR